MASGHQTRSPFSSPGQSEMELLSKIFKKLARIAGGAAVLELANGLGVDESITRSAERVEWILQQAQSGALALP